MLTAINPAPKHPAKMPVIMLAGIASIVGDVIGVVPNFRTAEDMVFTYSPSRSALKIAKVNTAIAQDKKFFQITVNFQKVLGFEISYAKSAPPIGAPNAADTPADVPAAIK